MIYSSYSQLVEELRDLSPWTENAFKGAIRAELRRADGPRERHIAYLMAKWNTLRRNLLRQWVEEERRK